MNVSAVHMSPVTRPAVPITAPEEIAIPPSEISVQFGAQRPIRPVEIIRGTRRR